MLAFIKELICLHPLYGRFRFLARAALATLVLCLAWSLAQAADEQADAPVIVVLGDSLSAAYNIPIAKGWVALLDAKIKKEGYSYKVINESISGDTSGNGLARLPAILRRNQVALLILALGANDGLRGYPLTSMKENLTRIVNQGEQAGAKVLLAGITIPNNYGARYKKQFEAVFGQVAQEQEIALVPQLLQDVPLEEEYFLDDRLHPNANAQPIILANIWRKLVKLL